MFEADAHRRVGLLARTEPGAAGLAAVGAGEIGRVDSLYLAIRTSRVPHGADMLAELGSEALDYALALLPGRIATVHATGGALFGEGVLDTAILILAAEPGAVATIELSRCLPPTIPTTGLGEVEVEVIGTLGALRIDPFPAVLVATDRALEARPLLDPPGAARNGSDGCPDESLDVQTIMAAVRLSLTRGDTVDMGFAPTS